MQVSPLWICLFSLLKHCPLRAVSVVVISIFSKWVTDERDLLSLFTYDDARILSSSSSWGSKTKTPLNKHIFEAVICLRLKEFENGVNIWGEERGWVGSEAFDGRHTNANLFWHWLHFPWDGEERSWLWCAAKLFGIAAFFDQSWWEADQWPACHLIIWATSQLRKLNWNWSTDQLIFRSTDYLIN